LFNLYMFLSLYLIIQHNKEHCYHKIFNLFLKIKKKIEIVENIENVAYDISSIHIVYI
jgi:phosphoribosylformylglycinamidine (FGAM) synthase-like enzyme